MKELRCFITFSMLSFRFIYFINTRVSEIQSRNNTGRASENHVETKFPKLLLAANFVEYNTEHW